MSNDSLPFEKVSVEDARKALDGAAVPAKEEEKEKDWRWARKWAPPEPLKEATATWLLRLPPEIRPIDLPQAYPRIINRLCAVWPQPELCNKYFEDLLTDRRGKRKGFPDGVLADLKALHQYYDSSHALRGPWDTEALRRR